MDNKKRKMLTFNADYCTGCRECELVCSFKHESKFNPKRSRIRVLSIYPTPGIDFAIICQHCEEPFCAKVCPQGAIGRNERSGAITISTGQCLACLGVECGACIDACTLQALFWDDEMKKPFKCDLCKGDPNCVKYCVHGALTFGEANIETEAHYKEELTKIREMLKADQS